MFDTSKRVSSVGGRDEVLGSLVLTDLADFTDLFGKLLETFDHTRRLCAAQQLLEKDQLSRLNPRDKTA